MEKNTNGSANANASFVVPGNENKEIKNEVKNEIINAKPSSSQASQASQASPDVSNVHIPK